jgi:aspartyl/asparaginyl beta-hydroxylase (cupin superfamily)
MKILKKHEENINNEIMDFISKKDNAWIEWVEKELCEEKKWHIIPLFAFGKWSQKNAETLPELTNCLKQIPTLKTALISRLKPHTKLSPHKGWANLANNVIRLHYGVNIPNENKCYMAVKQDSNEDYKIQYHKNKQWLAFDDSKQHYAANDSDKDRIILIIDIKRPNFIETGNSDVVYSQELVDLCNSFLDK